MRKTTGLAWLSVLILTGCHGSPTYQSHGEALITVQNSEGSQCVSDAIAATHLALADWRKNPDGSESDASFRENGRSWTDSNGRLTAGISEASFRSKDGTQNNIKTICIPGRPLIVLLCCDTDSACKRLHDELVNNLIKAGVKRKGP